MSVHTAVGTRIHIVGQEPTPPTPPSEPTMTKTNLLVITSAGHMSDDQHAKLTARVEAVASKVGAEVLVLGPDQDARLINFGVMPSKATAVEFKEGLRSCSAARTGYYSARLNSDASPVTAIQGEAVSFNLDPLEQAIESAVRLLRDEHQQMADAVAKQDSALCDRLGTHLDALLAIQLERVSSQPLEA